MSHERAPGIDDETVAAVGKMSEAFEYVERVRGHLFTAHQLMGRADLLFEDAANLLEDAGHVDDADRVRVDVIGRNVLEGRWTFQVVEEFDRVYYQWVRDELRRLEDTLTAGVHHLYEAEMKERRRRPVSPRSDR